MRKQSNINSYLGKADSAQNMVSDIVASQWITYRVIHCFHVALCDQRSLDKLYDSQSLARCRLLGHQVSLVKERQLHNEEFVLLLRPGFIAHLSRSRKTVSTMTCSMKMCLQNENKLCTPDALNHK